MIKHYCSFSVTCRRCRLSTTINQFLANKALFQSIPYTHLTSEL
uniref:Uncharacterized protein n=1 Tax=Arundo donax TaxID=35708 RepID=A0A0A9H4W7_ARUDO